MSATIEQTAAVLEARLAQAGIALTMGGEPTYVPVHPDGPEWSVAADGPTKLNYARALARQLQQRVWPRSTLLFCPGKRYDGEVNPRWALRLITGSNGSPLVNWAPQAEQAPRPATHGIETLIVQIADALGCALTPLALHDPLDPQRRIWAIPLAWDQHQWHSLCWDLEEPLCQLSTATGPAGLRLPLEHFPEGALRQVLTLELAEDHWGVFLPPVPREPFEQLLTAIASCSARWCRPQLSGVLPLDLEGHWQVLGLAADPGVLEINLPVCSSWQEYANWLEQLEAAGAAVGLRAYKQQGDRLLGTGGGNHLLLGGPSLEQHPFIGRPSWLAAVLRYWQLHPSLAYLFSGSSVGPASQAPRADEGSASLLDLELAYSLLDQLDDGDHRITIGETLRHLHADRSGNTHRSEISLDKFWNPAWSAGCQGLLEFRAIESMPNHHWSAMVALLWRAVVVMLLDPALRPTRLRDWGAELHDRALLPSQIRADLEMVLLDLAGAGLALPVEVFEAIWNWRFPTLLSWRQGPAQLTIRQALEPWPLLCDVPVEGGNTSRFVDSSLRRLEFTASPELKHSFVLRLQGRELPWPSGANAAQPVAVRYRLEALYPCLHPCLPIDAPLHLALWPRAHDTPIACWRLENDTTGFVPCTAADLPAAASEADPLRPPRPGLCTLDLRF